MAGVKGRSGGSRPNTGGARPGAGRKPVVIAPVVVPVTPDAATFLASVMNDQAADPRLRIDAAKALLRSASDVGKKSIQADAAKKAGGGKFAPAAAPLKLVR